MIVVACSGPLQRPSEVLGVCMVNGSYQCSRNLARTLKDCLAIQSQLDFLNDLSTDDISQQFWHNIKILTYFDSQLIQLRKLEVY